MTMATLGAFLALFLARCELLAVNYEAKGLVIVHNRMYS